MDEQNISDLPDYPALKQLAAALWKESDSYLGAAIMIGAGFSRAAAYTSDGSKKPPLWNHISKILVEKIGSRDHDHIDALRLAEEFSAYFGRQALRDLLKKEINDEALTPGDMHKSLLKLPWSEVLTTNWDTLLERALLEIHDPVYSIVNRQKDLSSAYAPRIVKLHGTIGVTDELVFTQEDYRKYPQNQAAFVNFARQVFIENELCLLGFSGDDPNFLQWSGWVRDHLDSHARRIYLVGALNLSPAKRKYLESINVAPVDLAPLVPEYDDLDTQHKVATQIFIEELQKLKPEPNWEWNPTRLQCATPITAEEINKSFKDAAYGAKLLEGQIVTLKEDRLFYPDWFVCPPSLFFILQSQINNPFPTAVNLAAMMEDSRAKLLYEIAWRHAVTYEVAPSWLVQELLAICDPDKHCSLTKKQQLEIALLLLKNSRWVNAPEAQDIEQRATAILEKNTKYWPESANELNYHRAIIARDKFDYPALESTAEKLDVSDSVWKLRKASLLAEVGRFSEGESLIEEAYRELLDQNRKSRNSIRVLSRLVWSHWLMRRIKYWVLKEEFRAFPSTYQDMKCSPWDCIEYIKDRITETLEKQQKQHSIKPLFEPGSYKDNSKVVSISNELHPLLLLDGISCTVGMPLRWGNIYFLVESSTKLAEFDDLDDVHRFALAIRSAASETSDVLNKVFSRVQIARFCNESIEWLFNRCNTALDYWNSKLTGNSKYEQSFVYDRLRVFIEVLARISVRIAPEQVKKILKKALAFGKIPAYHHYLLIDPLRSLIENSIKNIPEIHQQEVLMDVMLFPLPIETRVEQDVWNRWPNPTIQFPGARFASTVLDRRIDEIIDSIAPCSPRSASALLRLRPLLDAKFLTIPEQQKIGEKIWGSNPDYQALPNTGLLKHAFFKLPAPDNLAARGTIRQHLFEVGDDRLFDQSLLLSIAYAANLEEGCELPSSKQALSYFGKLISWRAKTDNKDLFGYTAQKNEQLSNSIGKALAWAVVPALPVEALKRENFNSLLAFYAEVDAPDAIIALSHFAAHDDSFAAQVEKLIRQGLQGQNSDKVASSAFALLRWRGIGASLATNRLTSLLVNLLGTNLGGGLPALLWTARQMYIKDYLPNDNIKSLMENIPLVFESADYQNISPSSREAVSISLVRAECVRLAKSILDKSPKESPELLKILEEAERDPLPEVRFAKDTDR